MCWKERLDLLLIFPFQGWDREPSLNSGKLSISILGDPKQKQF